MTEISVEEALLLIRDRLPSLEAATRRQLIADLSTMIYEIEELSAADAHAFLMLMLGYPGSVGHA